MPQLPRRFMVNAIQSVVLGVRQKDGSVLAVAAGQKLNLTDFTFTSMPFRVDESQSTPYMLPTDKLEGPLVLVAQVHSKEDLDLPWDDMRSFFVQSLAVELSEDARKLLDSQELHTNRMTLTPMVKPANGALGFDRDTPPIRADKLLPLHLRQLYVSPPTPLDVDPHDAKVSEHVRAIPVGTRTPRPSFMRSDYTMDRFDVWFIRARDEVADLLEEEPDCPPQRTEREKEAMRAKRNKNDVSAKILDENDQLLSGLRSELDSLITKIRGRPVPVPPPAKAATGGGGGMVLL